MIVSPTRGIRSTPTTKSKLMLPTTTMGFCMPIRSRLLRHRCNRDRSQSQQEEDKHRGYQSAGGWWGTGKFFPDEDAPDGRYHRRTLADGVGNGRTDYLSVGSNEIEYSSRTPDNPSDHTPEVP